MPAEALRFLIPHRILELSHNPEAVTLRIVDQDSNEVSFYIVEENSAKDKRENLDHWGSRDYVSEIIQPNDFVFAKIDLEKVSGSMEDDLFVKSYDDRRDLTGKGIGTNFYERLNEFAEEMGFDFITGQNNGFNKSFFLSIGRTSLLTFSDTTQHEFTARYGERIKDPENFTVMKVGSRE